MEPVALEWSDLDERAVDTARVLAMDAVQKVGNGHPGTAMALAPAAYLLYQRHLRNDPSDAHWIGRDRFVLSNGHTSLTLYIQLYLSGYGLELADLEAFRTWGSLTPGHPEYGHTVGVEVTTGPLGQGLANAVGMAMNARYVRGLLDGGAAPGTSPFDHRIYVIAGDGCLEEGVTGEASSLAGHQKLGSLIVLYDDNHISIEGNTNVAFSEDVLERYRSYGWQTLDVGLGPNGSIDVEGLHAALLEAEADLERPSIIRMRSIIGWPSPHLQNTGKIHGSALGADEVAATKEVLGFDPEKSFDVDPDVLAHARQLVDRGRAAHAEWNEKYAAWRERRPQQAALLDRLMERRLPSELPDAIPTFTEDMATRQASGKVINAIAAVVPEFYGGSADLAESNLTTIEDGMSFLPSGSTADNANEYGRILHFGVREHAMGAALNGMSADKLTRPFGGTFLVFSDYMRGAVRVAALSQYPVTFVWTHDSIGLGEDGPTHQPVEHLTALRAIPNFAVIRPADANETAIAWRNLLERDAPSCLALSRQTVPTFDRSVFASAEGVTRGAYVLSDCQGTPDVLLMASGSEVQLAVAAQEQLAADGIAARVISVPCMEWFADEDEDYRESVLPRDVKARVSVEAGLAMPWRSWVGDAGRCVSLEHFGASASGPKLFAEFDITADAVVAAAKESIAAAQSA